MRTGDQSPDTLFAIDVSAELRHLSGRQLRGPWQVPIELVRHLHRRGAHDVAVRLGRRHLAVCCHGEAFSARELEALATVYDDASYDAERQRAIAVLESTGAHCLLWAAGLGGARVHLEVSGSGTRLVFTTSSGVATAADAGSQPSTRVDVQGVRLDPHEAARRLREALRFASSPVRVNGAPVEQRFPMGLYRMRVTEPLPAVLSVAAAGDAPRLWLLQHGVVSSHATVPGYPAFQAAVEMGGVVPGPAPAAALREAVTPFLGRLVDQAVDLFIRLGQTLSGMPQTTALRVVSLLARAAAQGLRTAEILDLEMIPVTHGAGEHWQWRRPSDLGHDGRRTWQVIDPGQDPRRYALADRPAVVLPPGDRDALAHLLDVRFEAARPRPHDHRLRAAARRLSAHAASALAGRPLPAERLTEAERDLLAGLHALPGERLRFVLCRGSGPIRCSGLRSSRILLPRDNPAVRACLHVGPKPGWLYPILLALLDGHDAPPPELRDRWRQALAAPARG